MKYLWCSRLFFNVWYLILLWSQGVFRVTPARLLWCLDECVSSVRKAEASARLRGSHPAEVGSAKAVDRAVQTVDVFTDFPKSFALLTVEGRM